MWIRTKTKPTWYIHELRGVCYVSWVSLMDKGHASYFPKDDIEKWIEVLSKMTGLDLEGEIPFA